MCQRNDRNRKQTEKEINDEENEKNKDQNQHTQDIETKHKTQLIT